jgi:hypothetical protein
MYFKNPPNEIIALPMLDEKSVFILKRKILPYKDELEF